MHRPPSPPEPLPRAIRWRWRRGIAMTAVTAALCSALVACGTPRPPVQGPMPEPPAKAPALSKVASQVDVVGAGGPLRQARREQVLQQAASQGRADLLKRHLAAMSAFGDVDLYAGNQAKLLIDGPASFGAMFAAIRQARQQIVLESYIIEDADVATQLADLLIERRNQGVQVAVMYDAVGSLSTQDAYFDRMRKAGVSICAFNPVNPLKRNARYSKITHRDHRKILVVDGQVGYTGGINISAVYSSGSGSFGGKGARKRITDRDGDGKDNGWRDTMIEVRGPAVGALHQLVVDVWAEQHCDGTVDRLEALQAPEARPMTVAAPGHQLMRIVPSSPQDRENRIYTLLLGSIRAAQRSVYFTMAYFAPGDDMVGALADAARRGVDVQLILPSQSDFSPVMHAGRAHYERLLEAGVRIHELQDAVLHAKTAVIDGVVSTVGSSNMDWRSFVHNNEVNAVVLGEDFGQAMTRMFEQDRAASQPIDLQAWRDRPWLQRGKEFFSRLFEHWW